MPHSSGHHGRTSRFRFPALIVLAVFFLSKPCCLPAAEAEIKTVSLGLLEVRGGQEKDAWTLRYGTRSSLPTLGQDSPAFLTSAPSGRVWFVHGSWLRLIDTKKGVIVGRWHFPAPIRKVTARGAEADVEIEVRQEPRKPVRRTIHFDPASPHIPFWPAYGDIDAGTASMEARRPIQRTFASIYQNLRPEQAASWVSDLQEMVRRDPFSPWLRVGLGKLLSDTHDPRAQAVYRDAVETPGDYTEFLPMASFLVGRGQPEAAKIAFERGYRDFLARGNDPRLFTTSSGRASLFASHSSELLYLRLTGSELSRLQEEDIERIYALAPNGEGAEQAWHMRGVQLAQSGKLAEAQKWRARAEQANHASLFILTALVQRLDLALWLIALPCAIAGVFYFVALLTRYRPVYGDAARTRRLLRFLLFPFDCWSRRERIAFLLLPVIAWLSLGVAGVMVQHVKRYAAFPFSAWMGSFASPATINALEAQPASGARNLLLGIAYQQAGGSARAEKLYLSLPRSAVARNNLGVILANEGKALEARRAFQQALEIDPGLADASFNLGAPVEDFTLQQREKYLGRTPVIAPPARSAVLQVFGSPRLDYLAAAVSGPYSGALDVFDLGGG